MKKLADFGYSVVEIPIDREDINKKVFYVMKDNKRAYKVIFEPERSVKYSYEADEGYTYGTCYTWEECEKCLLDNIVFRMSLDMRHIYAIKTECEKLLKLYKQAIHLGSKEDTILAIKCSDNIIEEAEKVRGFLRSMEWL